MSSNDSSRFRRPAPLFDSVAESIPGEPDPATSADLAHDSARALLDGVFHSPGPEVVARVAARAADDGGSELRALCSRVPAPSPPGSLWRRCVLHSWAAQG